MSSKCEHNRQRCRCRECGGSAICQHNREKYSCKECGGSSICEHNRRKTQCKECMGSSICEHKREKRFCRDCGGNSICEHNRQKTTCKDCCGGSICQHNRRRSQCKECGGGSICEHNKQRRQCKDCEGSCVCEHNKIRSQCKECGGGSICEHNKQRSYCVDCGGSKTCKGHSTTMCYTIGSNKYKGYCVRCFQNFFPNESVPKNFRTKEKVWTDFINDNFNEYDWEFNKTIEYGCSKYRPDAILDMGSHIILLEHDENQHNSIGYSCENLRVMAIMRDCGYRPLVVIRFNPDEYIDKDGKKITSCWGVGKDGVVRVKPSKKQEYENRLKIFKEELDYYIKHEPEKEITEIKLFYDLNHDTQRIPV